MTDPKLDFYSVMNTMDSAQRSEVRAWGQNINIPAGTIIYTQDQNSDAVFVISSGTVEAITRSPDGRQTRSLAHMARGEIFGEVEVLCGNLRQGTVMAREDCELIRFEIEKFFHVTQVVPQIGILVARTLAKRLWRNTVQNTVNTLDMELSGHLQYFDLLNVFEAIIRSAHNGEMIVRDRSQNFIGSFFFNRGLVQFARFSHVQGEEAIWQGFLEASGAIDDCTFSFNIMPHPELPYDANQEITRDMGNLLLTGAMKRDAYLLLPEKLRHMEGRLQRNDENLNWDLAETEPHASMIWGLLAKRSQPIEAVWRRMNLCALSFLQLIREMELLGKISINLDGKGEED